ncbi:uncharacterized protein LOC108146714 [Drosophila elegans]|uniref:uncharacterized protein LOC108146714 n=1 Tax=Drosophila elegans TaxID=30023 RepID=UPI0007E76352|nr:uncharacterized protein LOC108146714 [Drosophila elegans]
MFESISFLFLFALAFVAWVLLCFHEFQIQSRGSSDYRVELYTEYPGITFEPNVYHIPSEQEQNPSGGAFDFAKSFGVIFALTFGLSKLLQLAEMQAKSYFKCLKELGAAETCHQHEPNPFEPLIDHSDDLKEQLSILQTQCLEMRDLLKDLRNSSSSSSYGSAQSGNEVAQPQTHSSEEPMVVWQETDSMGKTVSQSSSSRLATSQQPSQNVYITNSHIHFNGRVYLTENHVNVDLCRQSSVYARNQSVFLQGMGNYIREPKERPIIAGMRCNNILM